MDYNKLTLPVLWHHLFSLKGLQSDILESTETFNQRFQLLETGEIQQSLHNFLETSSKISQNQEEKQENIETSFNNEVRENRDNTVLNNYGQTVIITDIKLEKTPLKTSIERGIETPSNTKLNGQDPKNPSHNNSHPTEETHIENFAPTQTQSQESSPDREGGIESPAKTNLNGQDFKHPSPEGSHSTEETHTENFALIQSQSQESSNDNVIGDATVATYDSQGNIQNDYQPGEIAYITAENFGVGDTVTFQVVHIDPDTQEIIITDGDGHGAWNVTDGSAQDLDGVADGNISTTWYVNPDDSLDETFLLTATSSDESATHVFTDSGGAISIDWIAAAPFTYDHATGGGAYNDRTIGKTLDTVESLESGDFKCGDIVTYFAAITHDGTTPGDDPHTIEIDLSFLANTTGQAGVSHSQVVYVGVNYGPVQNGAGPNGEDTGNIDDGGSIAYLVSSGINGTEFTPGATLDATIRVTDIEAGEQIIVRVDTLLNCDPGSSPTGNLQADTQAARVVSRSSGTPTINVGNQTIPFKQFAGFEVPLEDVGLKLTKTVTTDLTGADTIGVDSLDVLAGTTVRYLYKLEHLGDPSQATGFDIADIEIYDDNGTPNDLTDDFVVFDAQKATGNNNLDNDPNDNPAKNPAGAFDNPDGRTRTTAPPQLFSAQPTTGIVLGTQNLAQSPDQGYDSVADDLLAGTTVIFFADVTYGSAGTYVNTASTFGEYNAARQGASNFQVLRDTDTATVNVFNGIVPASFSGNVYQDLNNDGVKDTGEPGIAGVTITLSGVSDGGDPINLTTVTDFTGNYSFTNLAAGTYTITETQPSGYKDGIDTLGTVGGVSQGTNPSDDTFTITLAAGESGVNYNFAELIPGSISGTTYFDTNDSLEKDITEATRSGVTVRLWDLGGDGVVGGGDDVEIANQVTDSNGNYYFGDLLPDTYAVSVDNAVSEEPRESALGSLGGNNAATEGYITTIPVTAGDNGINYNFGYPNNNSLPTFTNTLSGTVYEDDNNDGVLDAGESGIQGVTIELFLTSDLVNPVQTVTTDANGNYIFTNVAEGSYEIRQTQPTTYLDGIDTYVAGTDQWDSAPTVAQDDRIVGTFTATPDGLDITGNNFGELSPASISGSVYRDLDNDGVQDAGETGFSGIQITLTGTDDLGAVNQTVFTDVNGNYSFDNLRPGNYTVTQDGAGAAQDPGDTANFNDNSAPGGTNNGGTVTDKDGVSASEGDRTSNTSPAFDNIANIALNAGDTGTDFNFGEVPQTNTLSGTVYYDENGNGTLDIDSFDGSRLETTGLSGVTIQLLNSTGTTVLQTTTTDANGDYFFDGIANGTYVVRQLTQPSEYIDGLEQIGTGADGNGTVDQTADPSEITGISFSGGQTNNAINYNFGEILGSSLSGTAYIDKNNNGIYDEGTDSIRAGETIQLTGTDDKGQAVSTNVVTDANGNYIFSNLRPSNGSGYTLTETSNTTSLADVGNVGGTESANSTNTITLEPNTTGADYDFGVTVETLLIDLDLTKTLTNNAQNTTVFSTGDTVTFTLTLLNDGTNAQTAATGVTVHDTLPTGYTFVSATPSVGTYDSGTGDWTGIGTLAIGASETLTITATVNENTGSEVYFNSAQVTTADQNDFDSTPNNNFPSEDDQDNAQIAGTLAECLKDTTPADADTLEGGLGDDTLLGDAGNDLLLGGSENDDIYGGADNDTLVGGSGADYLFGQDGADVYRYDSFDESSINDLDYICNFSSQEGDRIDLPAAITGFFYAGTRFRQRSLTAMTDAAFANKDGLGNSLGSNEAVIYGSRGRLYLGVNNDGVAGFDPNADLVINVTGMTFAAGDLTAGVPNSTLTAGSYFI